VYQKQGQIFLVIGFRDDSISTTYGEKVIFKTPDEIKSPGDMGLATTVVIWSSIFQHRIRIQDIALKAIPSPIVVVESSISGLLERLSDAFRVDTRHEDQLLKNKAKKERAPRLSKPLVASARSLIKKLYTDPDEPTPEAFERIGPDILLQFPDELNIKQYINERRKWLRQLTGKRMEKN